jgi:DNA primase
MLVKDAIEEIKQRLLPSEIIGQKIKLKKVGTRLCGLCPFHQEKTPSFYVNDTQKSFHCFGCSKHGDIIDFICQTEGIDFIDALQKLAQIAGVHIKKKEDPQGRYKRDLEDFLSDLCKWFKKNLHANFAKSAKSYISKRISDTAIEEFKIGYCPKDLSGFFVSSNYSQKIIKESGILDKNGRCYFSDRIVFPIQNKNQKTIGFGSRAIAQGVMPKYINSSENQIFKKSKVLYSIDSAIKFCRQELIVVEGYMDVISLFEHGYKNVVATLGTSVTEHQLEAIFRISNCQVFCFDGDKAGIGAAKKTIDIIMQNFSQKISSKIRFAFLPTNTDPDSVVNKNPNSFEFILKRARSISDAIFFFCTQDKTLKSPEDFIDLERELLNQISLINNSSIASHFKSFFKNKIFLMKCGKLQSVKEDINMIASCATPQKNHLLLQIATKFPEVLQDNQNEELFCMLRFKERELSLLQNVIIDFLTNCKQEITKENLEKFLQQDNSKYDLYQAFLQKASINHIKQKEHASLLWQKLLKEIEIEKMQEEYKNILKSDISSAQNAKKAQQILEQMQKCALSVKKPIHS